ncbi:MAG TPA: N-acetylneuraminate synthase family protein [Candidatus Eisenbacteria bacterium]|nr:N-acetylneuraminate synthase family protein [Candidatus Eisenbacteria bacterium]
MRPIPAFLRRAPGGVFVIAEAGSNWKRSTRAAGLTAARTMIDAARDAGADAVKFQVFRADTVYVPNAGTSDYLSKNGIRAPIREIFRRMAMPYDMIPVLAAHCRRRGIEFMASAFSEADFRAVDPHVRVHKIASYEITFPRLIELAAESGKPLVLSTGAATLEDIDWAVSWFRRHGGRDLALLQCTAKYPAPPDALNLRAIPALLGRYGVPTGLSDHSLDPLTAPVAAVALGATIVEKHFTLNRGLAGPDHAFAITPPELKALVRAVRDCRRALGDGKKAVLPEETELKAYAQRAVQAIRPIRKGETLSEGKNIAVLRPGKRKQGVHPRHLARIEGRRARRAIGLGEGVKGGDYV